MVSNGLNIGDKVIVNPSSSLLIIFLAHERSGMY